MRTSLYGGEFFFGSNSMEDQPSRRKGHEAGEGAEDKFAEGMPLHDQRRPKDGPPAGNAHDNAPDAQEVARIDQRPRHRAGVAADADLEDLVADEDDDHREQVARVDVHESRTHLGDETVDEHRYVAHSGEVHGQGALALPTLLAEGGDHGRHGVGQHGEDGQTAEGDHELHGGGEDVVAEDKEQDEENAHHHGGNGYDTDDVGEDEVKGLFAHGDTFFSMDWETAGLFSGYRGSVNPA